MHDAAYIATSASYGYVTNRTMSFDSVGQLWRDLREPDGSGHLYGYDPLGRLVRDTLVYGASPVPCDTSGTEIENTGANCNYDFWANWWVDGTPVQYQYDSVGNRQPGVLPKNWSTVNP